ncbi:MAG: hypothetical protein KBT22_04600, partial [Bacteroidales bacterium]|nr:hypothetical protein [Candidatus Scybalocola fimicaballi]
MKHNILKILSLVAMMLCITTGFSYDFMKVAYKKIMVDDKLCYSIKKGYSRKDTTQWVPFCGELIYKDGLKEFDYEEGYDYTMYVVKFDPSVDTIYVKKIIASDNSKYWNIVR